MKLIATKRICIGGFHVKHYKGSCHCGHVSFEFTSPEIENGIRCNCSFCTKRGALMSIFNIDEISVVPPEKGNAPIDMYGFNRNKAKHYFCKNCGIHVFSKPLRSPDKIKINLNCVKGIDVYNLPFTVFNGKNL